MQGQGRRPRDRRRQGRLILTTRARDERPLAARSRAFREVDRVKSLRIMHMVELRVRDPRLSHPGSRRQRRRTWQASCPSRSAVAPCSAALAALALWPGLAARAQDDPLPSWNDGAAKQAIVDFVTAATTEGGADLRRARRPHRHLRPGRHHLGRAAALRPGPLRPRPPRRDGARASRVEGDRAVQVGADRRPRRDGEVHREGLDGDRRRHPRRHEHRPTSRRSSPTGCRSRRARSSGARSPSSPTSRCSR